jgi:hypothetical protein
LSLIVAMSAGATLFANLGFNRKRRVSPARQPIFDEVSSMTKSTIVRFALSGIALAALLAPVALVTGCSHPRPVVAVAPPPPPPEFGPVAQQGYHDGIQSARRDIRSGLAPDLQRHPRFRNPPVGPPEEYRRGFRAGYDASFRAGPPPPPPGY